jgi:hypothetical protein
MGKKNAAAPEKTYTKKEEKKLTKLRAKVTYHEARGKSGRASEFCEGQADYDECQKLHAQIKGIEDAVTARAWAS